MPSNDDEELRKAKLIAKYMINSIYTEIGKGVIKKLFWLFIGVIIAGAVYFGFIDIKDIDLVK